jgi:hypothetical protein
MTSTITQTRLTAAEAFAEIAKRQICLTCALNTWTASVEQVKSKGRFTRANLVVVSGRGPTPLAAVEALLTRLRAESEQKQLGY